MATFPKSIGEHRQSLLQYNAKSITTLTNIVIYSQNEICRDPTLQPITYSGLLKRYWNMCYLSTLKSTPDLHAQYRSS